MKEITIYECADGSRFDKKEDAMNYDVLLLKCSEVENSIGKIRELEYDQFIQRDAESVKSAWTKFCDIVAEAIPNYSGWAKECGAGIRHKSHLGRIIDVDSVSKYTWFLRFGKTPYPCAHVRPYGTVPLSRFVIQKYRNKDRTIVCDHIDRNPFNNRKNNLRICSASINSLNKSTKGYNVNSNGTYRARICINGQRIGLGSYKTKEEAIDKLLSFKDKKKDIYCWNPYTDSYNTIKDICLDVDADPVITLE